MRGSVGRVAAARSCRSTCAATPARARSRSRRAASRPAAASIRAIALTRRSRRVTRVALTRGMQGLAISAARRINRALARPRGEVFPYRYHATESTNPAQARNALAYILDNWRRHRADGGPWRLDPFSSAAAFDGWSRPHHQAPPREPLPIARATTWLLTDGYQRAGPITWTERPGPDPIP